MLVEMVVESVRVNLQTYQRVVVLKEKGSDRYLPIWIGHNEADAIVIQLQNVPVPRPQTHDLLKAVISQRLVRRADDKGRVPAVEIMIATAYIRDCIINPDKTRLIHDAIAAGTSQYGMQTFDQSIFELYTKQLITMEEALLRASNPDEFKLRVQGVRSASDTAREEMERQMADFERFARR